ncbi:MAG: cytochrome c3 family protein [Planctomycetota bacterium]|nr:cytochrome c3 family protein [Planctomycetota bacterium]
MRRLALVTLLLLAGAAMPAFADDGPEDNECMVCHGNAEELRDALTDPDRDIGPLLFYWAEYKRSVHAETDCTDCHQEYDTFPHTGDDVQTLSCTECHEEAGELHAGGVHGMRIGENGKPTASCIDCHGVHDVYKSDDRGSRLHPLNVHMTCGQCHFEHGLNGGVADRLLQERLMGDVHGHAILHQGLTVSATCVSCHGGHGIKPVGDPESRVGKKHVHETCAVCHAGVLETWKLSVHYKPPGDGEFEPVATCTDCHRPHHQVRVTDPGFRTEVVETCSACHAEQGDTFGETYHGKSANLGFHSNVAMCDSCHGSHDVYASIDVRSHTHPTQIVETCARCHPGSHAEFANYLVHADPADGEKYPKVHFVYVFMNTLLISVLIFGLLHALLWLIRATAAGEWKRPKPPKDQRFVKRWPKSFVFFHMAMMTIVLLLAITGLPIHYADKAWARDLMGFLGGPAVAGFIHRTAGLGLGVLFVLYMGYVGRRRWRYGDKEMFKAENSMLPRKKDFKDLWGNIKWFLFLAPRPKYDRWTYWEKFDFWAAFWGLFVIGITGFMLWFPELTTLVLPGWTLNAAVIIHGIEALLDIAFIFTVHVFHANLRPDKFPMDTMFLTGAISEEEFKHERPAEYERAVREGTLEAMLTNKPARQSRIAAYIIGTAALLVGFTFVAFMIGAFIERLF